MLCSAVQLYFIIHMFLLFSFLLLHVVHEIIETLIRVTELQATASLMTMQMQH